MSLGYADKLKQRKNLGGQLGWPEHHDSLDEVAHKANDILQLHSNSPSSTIFAFTGAGISTSIGIPDFRGPRGIWTLRKKGQAVPAMQTRFEYAKPSFTHMALAGLMRAGKLSYVCSQNVDSLHLRSGIPRSKLAELHGNCFAERCTMASKLHVKEFKARQRELGLVPLDTEHEMNKDNNDEEEEVKVEEEEVEKEGRCGANDVPQGTEDADGSTKVKLEGKMSERGEVKHKERSKKKCDALELVRDFEIETVGFKPTGRACPRCHSPMMDNTLDWDSPLPEDELEESIEAADKAQVCLVLGTSLQVTI